MKVALNIINQNCSECSRVLNFNLYLNFAGLRPNPSTVNPFVITTENKGGFKQSDHTKKVLSSSSNISEIRTTRATTEHRNHAKSTSENRNHDKTKDKNQSKVKNGSKNDKVKIDTSKKKNETNSKSKSENSLEEKKTLETKYVLFIGNLPYSVTKENLEEHFRKTGINIPLYVSTTVTRKSFFLLRWEIL